MRIPLYVGYSNLVFPTVADADSFIRMLNAVHPVYNFDNICRDSSVAGVTVCVDLNIPPVWELYLYKMRSTLLRVLLLQGFDTALAYIQPAHTNGFVYADLGTHIPDEDTLFGTGISVRLSVPNERKVWMGGSFNVQDFYYVIDSTITTAYELSRATYELPRYFFNHGLPANFVSNYLGTVNADYYKLKKRDFLRYTYNYQTLPPYTTAL